LRTLFVSLQVLDKSRQAAGVGTTAGEAIDFQNLDVNSGKLNSNVMLTVTH
jgi:hypothetical protein